MFIDPSDFIDEYMESDFFRSIESSLKDHAGAILALYFDQLKNSKQIDLFSQEFALKDLAKRNIPVIIKKNIVVILYSFYDFCITSGKIPGAVNWRADLAIIEHRYTESFREDGSFRGETFVNKSATVNRNDSCPCGSGKKFKKCCMALLEK